jgi:hypothetical protein
MAVFETVTEESFGVTRQDLARQIAEEARRHHHIVSAHPSNDVSGCWTDTYKASQALFLAAIAAAYPHVSAWSVYAVWVDCMEDTAYCAEWVRQHPNDIPTI